jgi:cholesterol transport system auxiliary component
MMRRRLALATILATAGCSLLPGRPYVERRDWPLVVRRPVTLPPRASGKILLVRTVTASPELGTRGLQWLEQDGSVHVDYYEQWAVPPAQAVDDDLRQWLAASGLYAAVLAPGSRLTANLVLESQLETFIADVPSGMARASLAVVLLDQQPNTAKVLLQRTITAETKLPGANVPDLVDALRAALREVLQQTESALAGA